METAFSKMQVLGNGFGRQEDGSYNTPYKSILVCGKGEQRQALFAAAISAALNRATLVESSADIIYAAPSLYIFDSKELLYWSSKEIPLSVFHNIKVVDLDKGTCIIVREDSVDLQTPRSESVYDLIEECDGGAIYNILYWTLFNEHATSDVVRYTDVLVKGVSLESGFKKRVDRIDMWETLEKYGNYFATLRAKQNTNSHTLSEMAARIDGALTYAAASVMAGDKPQWSELFTLDDVSAKMDTFA